ncbi:MULTISPECIES: hypothetical protein [unclassified Streptomyces]|uniref:hypothetical protein n=1 Tax=unclassified Streptomyces TaxID=2593676 RepID=UPI0036EF469B
MTDTTKNDGDIKPLDIHVTDAPAGTDGDVLKPTDIHVTDEKAGTDTVKPTDIHVTDEPA